jgi:hypothetical protein
MNSIALRNDDPAKHELRRLKWEELKTRMDAYRSYIKLILEINGFYYATTGAVMLFYLKQDSKYMEFFLLLPILMGTVIGGFLLYAAELQKRNQEIIENIREHSECGDMNVADIPDLSLLYKLLVVFGRIFFIVAGVLILIPLAKTMIPPISCWEGIAATVFAAIGVSIVIVGRAISGSTIREYLETLPPLKN